MVRALIVDDEEDFVEVVTKILEKEGYDTEASFSGEDALKKVENVKVDLILLDIMMPDMDGFKVCKRLQENPKTGRIPIVMVTAKGDFESIEKAYKCPSVKSYVAKPFEKEVLLKTIGDVIKKERDGKGKKKPAKTIPERVYREIYEGYPEGMALLDAKNIVLDVNNSFEAMTGFTKRDVIGLGNLPELLKPEDEKGNTLLVSEAFKACFCDDLISTATFTIVNKNGVKLRVVSTVFKIKSKVTVIILRNITKE